MSITNWSIVGAALAAIWCQAGASADVIFDNTATGDHGITTTSAPELGGEVIAAPGTSRVVTDLEIGFTSQGAPATADLQAFLYANDGPGGSPGTLLWASAVMAGVSLDTTNQLISFIVPSVTVPDDFTWASSITNSSAVVGLVPASGASIGTFVQPWVGSPGSWSTLPANFETEVRITAGAAAVPEPSTFAVSALLVLTGVAGGGRAPQTWGVIAALSGSCPRTAVKRSQNTKLLAKGWVFLFSVSAEPNSRLQLSEYRHLFGLRRQPAGGGKPARGKVLEVAIEVEVVRTAPEEVAGIGCRGPGGLAVHDARRHAAFGHQLRAEPVRAGCRGGPRRTRS